jgi:CubicO group peptidase (beta-lactamase class C family)
MTRNHSRVAGILAMTIAVAPLPADVQATLGDEWRDDVGRFAQSLVDAQLVPGMGIAVTQADWVVYSRAFGFADAASGRRADEGTAFYIASSTKALTATAVLTLAARRELDLDASIAHYLPALRGRGRLNADSVTLRDLLTMSHGIGIEDGGPVAFRTAYTGAFTPELLLELLADYRQSGPPRQFRYGNLGYNILGLVLAPRESHGWKDVVQHEVLDPLGMRETSARVTDFEPHVIALPHDYGADGKFRYIRLAKADANMHAAGGHFATPRDLARFVAAHASDGRLDGVQVFPREMIASAHRKRIEQNRRYGPFQRFGWGYGWDLGTYGDETIVSRFGAFSGYRSHMSFMPDRGTGVVVLVNGSGPASAAADVMATYIYDRLSDSPKLDAAYALRVADLRALADASRYNLAKDIAERRARQAPLARLLQDYTGVYENARLGRMEWRVVGGQLESRMGVAYSSTEVFDTRQNQLRVSFIGDEEVVEFAFPPGGGSARAVQYRGETFERVKD